MIQAFASEVHRGKSLTSCRLNSGFAGPQRFELSDAFMQRTHDLLDFFEREARSDVLRAVPIERRHVDHRDTLNLGPIGGQREDGFTSTSVGVKRTAVAS